MSGAFNSPESTQNLPPHQQLAYAAKSLEPLLRTKILSDLDKAIEENNPDNNFLNQYVPSPDSRYAPHTINSFEQLLKIIRQTPSSLQTYIRMEFIAAQALDLLAKSDLDIKNMNVQVHVTSIAAIRAAALIESLKNQDTQI